MREFLQLHSEIPENLTCAHKTGYVGVTQDYHKHTNHEVYLFLNGEANFFFNQNGYHMTRGKGVIIRSDVFHRIEYLNPDVYERITIHIKEDYLPSLNSDRTDLLNMLNKPTPKPYCFFELTSEQIDFFCEKSHILEHALRMEQFGDDLLCESIIRELLIFLNRIFVETQHEKTPDAFMPPLVSGIISYIHENPCRDLSVEGLSEVFHHNGHYISRRFKEAMGISLQQYIIYNKLEVAKQYIRSGFPLMQVCFLAGFHDYSNFAKTFSKYVGMSPKKYQKQMLH